MKWKKSTDIYIFLARSDFCSGKSSGKFNLTLQKYSTLFLWEGIIFFHQFGSIIRNKIIVLMKDSIKVRIYEKDWKQPKNNWKL